MTKLKQLCLLACILAFPASLSSADPAGGDVAFKHLAAAALTDQQSANEATPRTAVIAKECAPPEVVNSLPLQQVPGSILMTVTATIDGKPLKLLVDIGRMSTELWNTTATNLDLAVQPGRRGWDFGGRYSEGSARLESFMMGSMRGGGFNIQVGPDPNFAPAPFDGVMRTDIMWRYDIDLDFAHQRMNYFSPEQCKGAGVYWSPTTITSVPIIAYTGMEYGDPSPIPRFSATYVPVTLDGHTIIALLDTSSDRTFLNPDVAMKLFGLKPDSSEAGNISDSGTLIKAGLHRFSTLTFGGLTASNPQIAIPFDIVSQSSEITHIRKTARDTFNLHEIIPDMVIGMDVLRHSHLYLSFRNSRIYISAAGDGPALNSSPIKQSWFNVDR
jgi:Aspartyl protease